MRKWEAAGLDAIFGAGREVCVFADFGCSRRPRHVKSGQKGGVTCP